MVLNPRLQSALLGEKVSTATSNLFSWSQMLQSKANQTSLFLTQLQLQQNKLKLKTQNAQNREKSLKLVTK